jgi:hypothetical protein
VNEQLAEIASCLSLINSNVLMAAFFLIYIANYLGHIAKSLGQIAEAYRNDKKRGAE